MIKPENNIWQYFNARLPEPNMKILIDSGDDEIFESRTYHHNGKLMIEIIDGDEWLGGMSPKIFNINVKWQYK